MLKSFTLKVQKYVTASGHERRVHTAVEVVEMARLISEWPVRMDAEQHQTPECPTNA